MLVETTLCFFHISCNEKDTCMGKYGMPSSYWLPVMAACNGWNEPGVAACNGLWVCYLFFFSLYHTATELGARPLTMLHIVLNHLLHSSHFLVGQVKVALDVHHKV